MLQEYSYFNRDIFLWVEGEVRVGILTGFGGRGWCNRTFTQVFSSWKEAPGVQAGPTAVHVPPVSL